MAILLDFEKVGERAQEVEYIFGYRQGMDRRLVIEKASGNRNGDFGAVYVKILRLFGARRAGRRAGRTRRDLLDLLGAADVTKR